jgi:hypothetical protein
MVDPDSLPPELLASAWTQDGILMAFQHARLPVCGVQFHPESILTERGYDLLANFLRMAGLAAASDPSDLAGVELSAPRAQTAPLPTRPVTF